MRYKVYTIFAFRLVWLSKTRLTDSPLDVLAKTNLNKLSWF